MTTRASQSAVIEVSDRALPPFRGRRDKARRGLLALVALAALVSLAQFHVRLTMTTSIRYDDAHNASVAKNLALGLGYVTSYHELIPFDPRASTGPVVLVPAAAFIRLFGNEHWVPTFSIVVSIWAALLVLLLLLRPYLRRGEWAGAGALVALGLMLFHVDEFGLLGDVPASLLSLASVLLLCRPGPGAPPFGRVFAAGLLLGLAIETKLYMALVLPVTLAWLSVNSAGGESLARRVRTGGVFVSGALGPILAREVWQVAATRFSLERWAELKARQHEFVWLWSGMADLQETGWTSTRLLETMGRNTAALVDHLGPWQLALFPVALAFAVGAVMRLPLQEGGSGLKGAVLILFAVSAVHFTWWWALDREGWYRHLLPAIVYFATTAAVAAAASFRLSPLAGTIAVVLLLGSWAPRLQDLDVIYSSDFEPEPRLTALKATRDRMVRLQEDPDLIFVGYGWWVTRDLEYLLPAAGNFKDVQRLQPADVAGRRIVLVRNEFFNWEQSEELRAFQMACDRQVLFRHEPFVISVCPSLPAEIRQGTAPPGRDDLGPQR